MTTITGGNPIVVSHNQNILYIFLESYAKVNCAVVAIFIQDNIMAICLQCGFDLDRSFEKLFPSQVVIQDDYHHRW
jgi:hypothetical protein